MYINPIIYIFSLLVGVAYGVSRTVTLQAHYPRPVSSLYLRGNGLCGLNWNSGIQMKSHGQTNSTGGYLWDISINCDIAQVKKTGLELKVLIDDKTWMLGSNHHIRFDSDDQTTLVDDIYPWFYTYKGSLTIINRVYSSELNNFRDVIVYTPPSYTENTLKVHKNVLVMHDGQNLFNPATTAFGTAWMCQDTLDSMIIEGKMDELVLLGPYNTNDRTNEYTYIYDPSEKAGGKGDLYLNWIESTLLPLGAKQFRIELVRAQLGILGSSLGGLISCYAGWTRSTIYGKVGCMSSSFWWDENDYQNRIIVTSLPSTQVPVPVVYMDSGTSGGDGSCAVYTSQIYDIYQTKGFVAEQTVFKYIDQGGSHNEASWGARFYLPMQELYPPTTV